MIEDCSTSAAGVSPEVNKLRLQLRLRQNRAKLRLQLRCTALLGPKKSYVISLQLNLFSHLVIDQYPVLYLSLTGVNQAELQYVFNNCVD